MHKRYKSLTPTGQQIHLYRLLRLKCQEVGAKYAATFSPSTRQEYGDEIYRMKKAIYNKIGEDTGAKLTILELKYLDKPDLEVNIDIEAERGLPTRAQIITFNYLVGVCKERGITPIAPPDVYTKAMFRIAVAYLARVVNGPEFKEGETLPEGLRFEDRDDLIDNGEI